MQTKLVIKKETRARLATFGIKTSSWDGILVFLMDHADKTNYQME